VAVYDFDLGTWSAVGPNGVGFDVSTMISPLTIAADERLDVEMCVEENQREG
jgi:hypothetical protein